MFLPNSKYNAVQYNIPYGYNKPIQLEKDLNFLLEKIIDCRYYYNIIGFPKFHSKR